MSTGSQSDILNRLQNLQPPGWFAKGAVPLRDALLTGVANAFAFIYSLLAYVKKQTRVATATDAFLDIAGIDFFGGTLPRASGQGDMSYRARLQSSLFPLRNTRQAIIGVLTKVTGTVPIVIEPARAADVGCYNIGTCAYGVGAPYGSMTCAYQCFVTAFRPHSGMPQFGISDADIYAAVESVRMGATICWVRILNA